MKKSLNKKGFTLIEIVAVVTIMAILTAVILPNVLKRIDDNKKEQFVVQGKDMLSKAKYLLKLEEDLQNSEIFTVADECYEITLENLGLSDIVNYPKPVKLIEYLLRLQEDYNITILCYES